MARLDYDAAVTNNKNNFIPLLHLTPAPPLPFIPLSPLSRSFMNYYIYSYIIYTSQKRMYWVHSYAMQEVAT